MMMLNQTISFLEPVKDSLQEVETTLRLQAHPDNPDLKAAIDLLLSAGGKRIRPVLSLLIGKMLGARNKPLVAIASAIELLHTATLVHDDLIDGALLRRGMPTLNSKWSPGATVLTGDYLFARAALKAAETDSIPIIHIFANTLSTIVNGEIRQLFTGRCQVDRQEYYHRIYAKTASLFETSSHSAALLCPLESQQIEDLKRFGRHLGIAFQIMDDILDFTGEQNRLGKPIGSDLRQGIVTLPVILYSELYPQDANIQDMVAGRCINSAQIDQFIATIAASPVIDEAVAEAEEHVKSALDLLGQFPNCIERQSLEDLAEFIIKRQV